MASYYESVNEDDQSVAAIKYTLSSPPDEDNKWAYNLWGTVLMKNGYNPEATEKLNKSIKLDPQFFLPIYNLGQIALGEKKYDEALKQYNKSIALNNQFDLSYNGLANTYLALKEYRKADSCTDLTLKVNAKNGDAYFCKAQINLAQRDTSEAITNLHNATDVTGDKKEASSYYLVLGALSLAKKDNNATEQFFGKAYRLNKEDFFIATTFRNSMITNGDTAMANKFTRTVINPLFARNLAMILVKSFTKQSLCN